jgi:hypothetical protein
MKNNLKYLNAVLILMLFTLTSNAQISQFLHTAGGIESDNFLSIVETHDGGYLAAGQTNSFGTGLDDVYLVKFDINGSMLWSKSIGGAGVDIARSVIKTSDGGYAVAGYTNSFGALGDDFLVIKLDNQYNLQWSRIIGGPYSDLLYGFIQTPDSGFVCAGMTESYGAGGQDVFLVKLNSAGNLQWSKTFGGAQWDRALFVINSADGGFAVTGLTYSFGEGNSDVFLAKFSGNGTLQWSKTVGGIGSDEAFGLTQSSDGGFATSGWSNSLNQGAGYDCYITRFDANGNFQWDKAIVGNFWDNGNSIIATPDNGYIIAGRSIVSNWYDCYFAKLNGNGNILWNKKTDHPETDVLNSMIKTTDNKFVAVGRTNSLGSGNFDGLIMKIEENSELCGNYVTHDTTTLSGGVAGNPSFIFNTVTPIVNSVSPSIISGGILTNVCSIVNISGQNNEIPERYVLYQNYPNPFNPSTKISYELPVSGNLKLTIYNTIGQTVVELVNTIQNAGRHEVEWNAAGFTSGVYFYRLEAGSFIEAKKMLMIK